MKSISLKLSAVCLLGLLLSVVACKKKATPTITNPSSVNFDRKGMLTNLANNLIIPSYQALNTTVITLDSSVTVFNTSQNITTLANLQAAFKNAYLAWQSCSAFEVGPADQLSLNVAVNTFPTDTHQISTNINSGSYNLAGLVNQPARGFPAIDYLLFGIGADANAILAEYTTDSKAAGRKQYLAALSADIKTNIQTVLSAWQSGYTNTFVNATGSDVGSSLGLLMNSLDYDLEILKNDELGIPLGKHSMGNILPNEVEAYYSGISVQLAVQQLKIIQNIYLGKSIQGSDGLGLDDYLVALNAQYNNGSLNDAIKAQFNTAITDLGNVPDPLSNTIITNATPANKAYVDIQKLVVLMKTDMPSATGILITFVDNDGD
ncbi:MAG: imelysin family protein [Bacteroidia bacterium]